MAEQSTPFLNAPQSSADVDPNTVRKEEVQEAEPTQQGRNVLLRDWGHWCPKCLSRST